MKATFRTITMIAVTLACAAAPAWAAKAVPFDEAMAQAQKDLGAHCKGMKDGAGKSKGWFFVVVDAAFPTVLEGKPYLELSVEEGAITEWVGPLTKPVTPAQAKSVVGRSFCIKPAG